MPPTWKIALAQIDVALADPRQNLARLCSVIRETAATGARLTVFPEAALTGYCFDSLDEARPMAEPIPGPSAQKIHDLCRELGVFVIFGLLELDGPRVFNTAALVGPQGGRRHVPQDSFAVSGS